MHWIKRWINGREDIDNEASQDDDQDQIVLSFSKIESRTQAIPKQNQVEDLSGSLIQSGTKAESDKYFLAFSKMDNHPSSRTQPNNPAIRALVDEVTRTHEL